MTTLNRNLAPLSAAAWSAIDEEAADVLKVMLAGRKLVDFKGPLGWSTSAIDTGRVEKADAAGISGVEAHFRKVQPLVELRREFELSRSEMESSDRGAKDAELDPVVETARDMAIAEDSAILKGLSGLQIEGICPAAAHGSVTLSKDYENYPAAVAQAISTLRDAGVDGPYAIALGPRCFTGLNETRVNGFPVLKHVSELVDVPPVSAPALYLAHDSQSVRLFMEESFTFRVLGPEAAVPLVYSA